VNPHSLRVPLIPNLCALGTRSLSSPVLKEEVKDALFFMQSYKAPGPDGFQPLFFKHFWEKTGESL